MQSIGVIPVFHDGIRSIKYDNLFITWKTSAYTVFCTEESKKGCAITSGSSVFIVCVFQTAVSRSIVGNWLQEQNSTGNWPLRGVIR